MAERRSTARRTNLALSLIALLLVGASVVVALVADPPADSVPPGSTVELSSPGSATRPADTRLSWFDHANSETQYDFEMETLRCEYLDQYLTNDVCAVASTSHGSFMIAGAEQDWDPFDTDYDGWAYVPFSLTAYVLRTDGTRHAFSLLDGRAEKAYSYLEVSLDLWVADLNGEEVIVIVEGLADESADPYDYSTAVQIIAMSPTGAPTLVAAYEGYGMVVRADGGSLVLSSLRYGVDPDATSWCTHLVLTPSTREPFGWDETPSAGTCPASTNLTLASSYTYPVDGTAPDMGREPASDA